MERPLSRLCYKHAWFVAEHPWPFIVVPLLLSIGLGAGFFFRFVTKSPYVLFTPTDGLGLIERETIKELFPPTDGAYTPSRSLSWDGESDLVVAAKDGGNILRKEYRKAVNRLNEFIMDQVFAQFNGIEYNYRNICMKFLNFCHNNPQIYAVDLMLSNRGPYDNLTYPMAYHGKRRFYMGNTLGDVDLDPLSHQIIGAKAWQLVYQVKIDGIYKDIGELWQRMFEKQMLQYNDPILDVYVFHSQSIDLELKRNGQGMMLKFLICVLMLLVFSTICSMSFIRDYGTPYIDWSHSKPTVAIAGMIGAIMGVATSIGLLSFCRYPYSAVVDAMPFLVLGMCRYVTVNEIATAALLELLFKSFFVITFRRSNG